MLVAEVRVELIGAAEVRDCDHISLLFVTHEWQGQGVARKLLHHTLAITHRYISNVLVKLHKILNSTAYL
ncbi:MAG: GNAT family N-acetyltransferase [Leptolyngbya sp. SIO1E4]|nr:GNAT family N-acetyltransferase [Leptolyngbya sp. SIO1E4]